MKRYAGLLLLPPLIAAVWFSSRLARADYEFRRNTPPSVERAVELAPTNTDYLLLRAMQLEYDGADPTPLLERAENLNPMNAAPRIRLGLAAEIRGDFDAAEKYLLDAARVNRQFEPRWTLANFYFRRGNTEQFWNWMRAALDVSYGDRRPAFDLCWNASNDAGTILNSIPSRREVLSAYLQYLTATRHEPAIPPVAFRLAALHQSGDEPALLASIDALIAVHDASAAKSIWQALGLSTSTIVFRGDFTPPDIGAAFDWQFVRVPGVTHLAIDQPFPMHRILLDGSEPESTDLLRQFVTLTPNARYKLTWQSRTQDLGSPTGLEWRIANQRTPIESKQSAGEFQFTAPGNLASLTLTYARPVGETRAEGSIELWRIAITPN